MSRLKLQIELTASIGEVKRDIIQNEEEVAKRQRMKCKLKLLQLQKIYEEEQCDKERLMCHFVCSICGIY